MAEGGGSPLRKVLVGSGSNVVRLILTSSIAVVLPPILTRALSKDQYSAWVTLLQLSTYLGLLDLGLQTTVAKFIAQHHAEANFTAAVQVVRTAFRLLSLSALLGVGLVVAASQSITTILPDAPDRIRSDMSSALLILGLTSVLLLPFGPCLAAFTGLQLYVLPTILSIATKAAQVLALALVGIFTHSLTAMASAYGVVGILTVCSQLLAWRKIAWPRLGRKDARFDWSTAKALLSSGAVIALWLVGGLFVSGIDLILVGRFELSEAGAYALASSLVSLLVAVVSGLFSPLLPTMAALSGEGKAARTAQLAMRSTALSTTVICSFSTLLMLASFPVLSLWVGVDYATSGAPILQILLVANALRQLMYVYSLSVIATGQQRYATLATLSEAVANFGLSVWLGSVLGATGVAIGSVLGAIVSVMFHFLFSMRATHTLIPLGRTKFGVYSLILPALSCAPLMLVFLIQGSPPLSLTSATAVALATLLTSVLMVVIAGKERRARMVGVLRARTR